VNRTSPDRGSHWLAIVVAALLATQSVAWTGPSAGEPPEAPADGRARIAEQLVEIGRTPDRAQDAAGSLTVEDLAVLLANPEMMQAAGDVGLEMTIGTILVIGIIVGLAVAGSTFIVIST
jgi:hypothetical protein